MKPFDIIEARRIVEQVLDQRYPIEIRAVIKLLLEACEYIEERDL